MTSYERKLDEFADGKNFVRLSRPVRDRADASCDACGSAQPRTLYALKDQDSERYHFVGVTCLEELVRRGVIRRRFGRESGQVSFDEDMKRRAKESGDGPGLQNQSPGPEDLKVGGQGSPASVLPAMFPALLVLESSEYYEAFAYVFTEQDATGSTGYATEARYEEVWRTSGPRGMLLERVRRPRSLALRQAITSALHEASSQIMGREELRCGSGEGQASSALPLPLFNLLELVARVHGGRYSSRVSEDGVPLALIPRDGTSV